MATLKEYFDTDFSNTCILSHIGTYGKIDEVNIEIISRVHIDFTSNTKYLSYYIPENNDGIDIVLAILSNIDETISVGNQVNIEMKGPGELPISAEDIKFSGKIFIYSESEIDSQVFQELQDKLKKQGIYLQYRGKEFVKKRSETEKPLAFISHDSRDKSLIASVLAMELTKKLCPIWYDEYSLNVGDNLRESIEAGIKETKKCILILTPNFLKNSGWTKKEFDSVFIKNVRSGESTILPIWFNVRSEEIYEYCPSLAGTVALTWPDKSKMTEENYSKELGVLVEKIHIAIKS